LTFIIDAPIPKPAYGGQPPQVPAAGFRDFRFYPLRGRKNGIHAGLKQGQHRLQWKFCCSFFVFRKSVTINKTGILKRATLIRRIPYFHSGLYFCPALRYFFRPMITFRYLCPVKAPFFFAPAVNPMLLNIVLRVTLFDESLRGPVAAHPA
jgi:hypothetical protein